jgi:glycerol uptake facilitator-like aquaporin
MFDDLPPRRLAAEAIGAALLAMGAIGSGIMAERLSNGNIALALLVSSLATAAMAAGLLLMLAEVTAAYFNPAVALALVLRGEMSLAHGASYAAAQIAGALAGAVFTHVMFGMGWVQNATQIRSGLGAGMGEAAATGMLMLAILSCRGRGPAQLAAAVGLVIAANFWATNSTALANPAITIARTITDTFASVRPADAAVFIAVELAAAAAMALGGGWLLAVQASNKGGEPRA